MVPARVVALARYPVKSLLGEQVTHLSLDRRGVVGDRVWSLRTAEGKIGSGKNTRRFAAVPGLLTVRARDDEGQLVITLPDGSTCRAADADDASERLSRLLGQPLTLAIETNVSHFDDGPVSLLGSASVVAVSHEHGEHVDPARFRANIVVETDAAFAEQEWIGRQVQIGTTLLAVTMASPRCVMVEAATFDVPTQPGILSAVGRVNRARLGVVATVIREGIISIGDTLDVQIYPA